MAEGILGLGSSGSTGLSQELIDKLKAAESKAKIDPYDTKLETWEKELEKISEIDIKTKEILDTIKDFDLFSTGTNKFDQVTANTSGTSAVFDAIDVAKLTEGTNVVNITQLAQRDVYQTSTFSDKDVQVVGGNDSGDKLSINVAGSTYDFSTVNMTYSQLAEEINKNENITASVEQVADSEFRLIIKSTGTGEANKLTISQEGVNVGLGSMQSRSISDFSDLMGAGRLTLNGTDVISETELMSYDELIDNINNYTVGGNQVFSAVKNGDTIDITAIDGSAVSVIEAGSNALSFKDSSYILEAQNMKATVDGISFDVSENKITIQNNLTITAIETGISTISLQKDTSAILPALNEFVTKYNELVTLIDEELYSDESSLNDPGSIRMMMASIKDSLFSNYGLNDDKNIFNYGFNIDETGLLSIDEDVFNKAVVNDLDGLESLFVGVAEKEGLATTLKIYLDSLDGFDGILTTYGDSMVTTKTGYEEEKEKAQKLIDSKYSTMASQFAAYTAIITQMEASFGGMKMMMDQSTD
ncbi:MAG TPA: hypothetical protein EYG97_05090 [Arcobacter sp.]|nr:hypothetical protein [Arcobacter sp.]